MKSIFVKDDNVSKDEIIEFLKNNLIPWENKIIIIDNGIKNQTKAIWDLVGTDDKKGLVFFLIIINFKNKILFDIIENIDWTINNFEIISKQYSDKIRTNITPRFILISHLFSPIFQRIVSGIKNIEIELISYKGLRNLEQKGILFEKVNHNPQTNQRNLSDLHHQSSKPVYTFDDLTKEEIDEFYK